MKRLCKWLVKIGLILSTIVSTASLASAAELARKGAPDEAPKASSKLFSPDDGWLDVGGFLDQPYGFIPVVIPITEPSVGYGAAVALTFIDKPNASAGSGFGRPNITVVGALRTENGTRGAFAGDVRHWLDDRLQTLVGAVNASVNLDYYGIGQDKGLSGAPLRYNIEAMGVGAKAQYRLGNSKSWVGLGYIFADSKIRFDAPPSTLGLPNFQKQSRIGGLVPSITYDSRDNIFTPTSGTYLDASIGFFSPAFGSDQEFQRLNLNGIHYLKLNPKLTLGVNGSTTMSFGDVPFYMRPFISLRGVPVMRYQGEQVAQIEAELRWQFWQRFSLVGFAGAGAAWNDSGHFNNVNKVATGGMGIRYELARKYGLHMGLDVAYGKDGPAVYVQFGSAWMRP